MMSKCRFKRPLKLRLGVTHFTYKLTTSLSCVSENLRMAVFYSEKARNILEHATLVAESNTSADLSSYIESADKYQAHALQYSSIAKTIIEV